jgi:antitoxin VapB
MLKEISKDSKIGSDVIFPGTVLISDQFKKIRYSLLGSEIKRYRWLGREVTEAVAEVCKTIKPGMDEYEIEALTSASLRARGILPTVLLIAVDNRIFKYRHALPGGAKLDKYAMINVCAEKWGMPIAVTRFVYFGKLPGELKNKFEKTAKIFTQYELVSVPGNACADIFEQCKKWYEEAGFPDEWKKHHQGGAIGYDDREYVIYPGIKETVQDNQAFAWNPTITGAKVEDTFIAYRDHFEVITKSKGWPMITVEINGKKYEQPGVLIR